MHFVTSRSRRSLHPVQLLGQQPALDEPSLARRLMSDLDRSKLGIEATKDGSEPPVRL